MEVHVITDEVNYTKEHLWALFLGYRASRIVLKHRMQRPSLSPKGILPVGELRSGWYALISG